eukprot:Seg1048.2 transcript_id=Seg1048.2/GoldUCD/mRNA.D3Y31 product="hypothetical protein" protein_id=Seg1048.2/GoldUCD/D3Y31
MDLVDQEKKNKDKSSTSSATDDLPGEIKDMVQLDTPKQPIVTSAKNSPSILAEETHDEPCHTACKTDKVCARSDKEFTSEPNCPSILASSFDSVTMDDVNFDSKANVLSVKSSVDASFQLDNGTNDENGQCTVKDGANDEEDIIFTLMDAQVDTHTLKKDKSSGDLNTNLEENKDLEADDILGDLMGISSRKETNPRIMIEDDDLLGEFENLQQEIMDAEMSLDEYAGIEFNFKLQVCR